MFKLFLQVIGRDGLLNKAYNRLTSRDPKLFWTSGQWMTERKGGSDVGWYNLHVCGGAITLPITHSTILLA